MAAAAVVIGLARSFADIGLSSAIIAKQIRNPTRCPASTGQASWRGVAVFGIVLALTPLMVRFFGEPSSYHIIPWTALAFVIIPIGQQFQMCPQMEMRSTGS